MLLCSTLYAVIFTLSADEAEFRGQLEPNLLPLDTKVYFASFLF